MRVNDIMSDHVETIALTASANAGVEASAAEFPRPAYQAPPAHLKSGEASRHALKSARARRPAISSKVFLEPVAGQPLDFFQRS